MKQHVNLRGYFGLAIALVVTLIADLLAALVGAPWRILLGWQPFQPFSFLPYCWAKVGNWLAVNQILGVKMRLYRPYLARPPRPNEVTIIIANHPPTTLLLSFCWFVFTMVARRAVAVGKIEHVWSWYAPLFGWGMWGAWGGVFINRENREQAFEALRRAVAKMRNYRAFIIFPDKSRPTPEKVAQDVARYRKAIPGVADWLKHTLVPRTGGLLALLEACDWLGAPVRIVDITIWSSRMSQNVRQAGALVNATVWLEAQEFDGQEFPRERAALEKKLNALWQRKNRLITEYSPSAAA